MENAIKKLKLKSIASYFLQFQVIILILSVLSGFMIANRPMLFGALLFTALLTILFIKYSVWAVALLVSAGTNFFGAIRPTSLPSITLPGIGALYINDIMILLFAGILILKVLTKESRSLRSSISYPIVALFVLTGLQAGRSLIEGSSVSFIANQLRDISSYLLFFIILGLFKKEDIVSFLKALIVIAIITAAVTYYQTVTGEFALGSLVVYSGEYNLYRSYNVGLFVMTCVFLVLLAFLIGTSRNENLLNNRLSTSTLIFVGGAILVMLMRNVWISLIIASALIFLINITRVNKSILVIFLAVSIFSVFWLPVMEYFIGPQPILTIISKRGFEAFSEASTGGGTFGLRTDLLKHRWEYMLTTNPFFGQGFKETSGNNPWDPTYATGENTLAFIATRYGLSGFILFGWLLLAVLKKMIKLYRNLNDPWQKSLICGLLAFNIHIIITSYFGAPLVSGMGLVVLAPTWAISELMSQYSRQATTETQING